MSEPLIVFVCTANVCRSPWAELRAKQLLPGFAVGSGATLSSTAGRPMDDVMAATLPAGVEVAGHRAKPLSPAMAREASLILTMEERHRAWVLDEYPGAIRKTFTVGQFAATVSRAPEGLPLDELLLWAYRNRVPSSGTDISDPYRQGPERAAETAELLDRLLAQMAPVLVQAVGT